MKVNINFEVDLPDEFVIEKEQSFDFAPELISFFKKKLLVKTVVLCTVGL
jgi:hypothetical protein